jgi:hypothetical protein
MSDLIISTPLASDILTDVHDWHFTFGPNHAHPATGEKLGQAYVVIPGTYAEARQKMIAEFGQKWSRHQYANAQLAGVERWQLRQVELPSALVAPLSKIWACPEPDCGYHIADGPIADGDVPELELIREHLEEHAVIEMPPPVAECGCPIRPASEVRGDAADTVVEHGIGCTIGDLFEDVASVPVVVDPARTAYIAGLREIADFLETHPDVELPYLTSIQTGRWENTLDVYLTGSGQRAQLAAYGRALGKFEKTANSGDRFKIFRRFGGITLVVSAGRDEVCERVVVGTTEVTREVPDPEILATVPTITVTEMVDEVRWECRPLLQDVAAAHLTPDAPSLQAEVAA